MLATGVYTVIKKKEGVVESLSLSLTFEKKTHPHILGLVLHSDARPAKTKGSVCAIGLHQVEQKCIQLKPRADNNRLSKTNTNPRGN